MAIDTIKATAILDGAVDTADLADGSVTAVKLDAAAVTPAAVSDTANTSTGGFTLPAGTTAQRPGSPDTGESRMNTTTGSLEFYDGTAWIATNLIPTVDSVSGTIYAGAATDLTITLTNATDTIDVVFKESGSIVETVSGVSVSSGSATVTVPAAVYGQTAGDTIVVSVNNQDGTPSSNAPTKTVKGIPTGGTVTTSGNYRYHTFTSSGNFVVPSGFTASADYLLVAGGGSHRAGQHATGAGGGGAGGAIDSTVTLTAQTYSIVIGAGGAGAAGAGNGNNGDDSTAFSQTAIGGGRGGGYPNFNAGNGGSGGGGGYNSSAGTGTSGQGNNGGLGIGANSRGGGGGGGAGAVGGNYSGADSTTVAGNGGDGINWKSLGTYYAGGGGGGVAPWTEGGKTAGTGGQGGGGNGARSSTQVYTIGGAGTANTGGGAGGASVNGPTGGQQDNQAAANGGSGICIVRYQLP